MKRHNEFLKSFHKTAATKLPSWAHELHKTTSPKSLPGFTKRKRGLRSLLKYRGVKA